MNRIVLFLISAGFVLGPVLILSAADVAAPGAEPLVAIFDTVRPPTAAAFGGELEAKTPWQRVAEDKLDHGFQGDAVLCNRRVAAVMRRNEAGVEVYSRGATGWKRQALLIPAGADAAKELLSLKTVANDGAEVVVEATFRTGGGQTLGLVCRVTPETSFVRADPCGETRRLRIQTVGRFGVIPDFYTDDITLDATKLPMSKVCVPSENMIGQLLEGGQTLAVALWDGPPQEVEMTLAGDGPQRVFAATEIQFAKQGKVYLGFFDAPGLCYVGQFGQLPDRTEPVAGFKLLSPVKRLDWKMPFPAQWRVDYVTASVDPKLLRSREMAAPFPYPVKDSKCEGFRFIKPSYVWDWGGGKHTEMSGTPDKYPTWVDFEGRGFVRPITESYAVIVYPFDRGRGTPLSEITLTDLVRQTLGVGPCQYILDADRRMAQTPGIFTCGGTDMLKKMQGDICQRRAEAEKLLDDMLVFMKAYRRRIEQYMAFRRDLTAYLDAQEKQHPDQQPLIHRVKSLLDGIPAELKEDYPAVVEKLGAEYRATLGSDDEAAKKKRTELHPRFPAAGGAQDNILQRCHQVTRLLRYQAGMTPAADPATAETMLEVRRRASAVLQNPMYHETKDRHRSDGA